MQLSLWFGYIPVFHHYILMKNLSEGYLKNDLRLESSYKLLIKTFRKK